MNPTHPQQLSTRLLDPSVLTRRVYFKRQVEVYLPCLARELWQVCEWDLIGFGLHNLRIVLCNAKKLKVVLPVNASSSCWIPYVMRPMSLIRHTSNTHCNMHRTEYAQQNHFSYGQPVKIGRGSLLSTFLYLSGGPTRLLSVIRSPYLHMSSANPMEML